MNNKWEYWLCVLLWLLGGGGSNMLSNGRTNANIVLSRVLGTEAVYSFQMLWLGEGMKNLRNSEMLMIIAPVKGPYLSKWHVLVLALLYLYDCLNDWRQHSDRSQLLETSVGNLIRFWKRRIMTNCRSLHFCLLDQPISNAVAMFQLFVIKVSSSQRFDYFLLKIDYFIIY